MKVDAEMVELWQRYEELQRATTARFDIFMAASGIKLKPGRLERFAYDWAIGAGMTEGEALTFGFFIQNRSGITVA